MNFEDICQQYQTWVIRISSSSLLQPVFVLWLTDSTDGDRDKFVVNDDNEIIASEDIENLLDVVIKVNQSLPDLINTSTWLDKVRGLKKTTINFALESLEESIESRLFNKRSILEAINFINLCGDFDEQTGDSEIRGLRNKPNIRRLWEYGYDEIIWKEIELNKEIEPICLPKLQTNPDRLTIELHQLITAFLTRLDIRK